MTDTTFDLFALHQWETDGGPAFDDADEIPAALAGQNSVKMSAAIVAPRDRACLIYSSDHTETQED